MEQNKMKSGIYSITNKINNKKYIGLSNDVEKRIYAHKKNLLSKTHVNFHLQKSVEKYGIENFVFEIVEFVEEENLSSREIYWINYYDSVKKGYNILLGGKQEYSKKVMLSKNGFPPQFIIRYLYDGYEESIDFYCRVVFKISLEDLIAKEDKTYFQKNILKKYLSRKEKLEDLLSGRFEKYKDKRKLNKLIDYRSVVEKSNIWNMSAVEFKLFLYAIEYLEKIKKKNKKKKKKK